MTSPSRGFHRARWPSCGGWRCSDRPSAPTSCSPSPAVREDEAYQSLDAALTTAVVEPAESGYRFRHALVRDAVLATYSPHDRSRAGRWSPSGWRRSVRHRRGSRTSSLERAPGAGGAVRPPAIETAGALGAYRDGLALLDAVVDHANGADRAHLLARRGDLLTALAEPGGRRGVPGRPAGHQRHRARLVRARLARAAAFQGDIETATAALSGLELEGDEADATMLLARGNLAYFVGDIDAAWDAANEARTLLRADDPWQMVDLISLQGLIAHQRGEWFERFVCELRRSRDGPGPGERRCSTPTCAWRSTCSTARSPTTR